MGHRDFLCANDSPYVDRLHDALHDSVPDVSTQQAAEDIAAVFAGMRTHAFGLNREQLVEAMRSRLIEAADKEIEYLALASILPERYGRLIGWGSEWSMGMREYARQIANDEVRI